MALQEYLFEEHFAPYLFEGELITPQATLIRQPTLYGALKAFWNHASVDDEFSAVRWYEEAEGIVLEGEEDILILKRSWHPNRFFIRWTSHDEEDPEVLTLGWLVETADGKSAWFKNLSDLLEVYPQFYKSSPDATLTYSRRFDDLFNF